MAKVTRKTDRGPLRPKFSDVFAGLSLWGFIGTVAWQTAGPILMLATVGGLLDHRLHTGPGLLLLGVVASVAVSWVLVRGTIRRMQAQIEELVRRGVLKP